MLAIRALPCPKDSLGDGRTYWYGYFSAVSGTFQLLKWGNSCLTNEHTGRVLKVITEPLLRGLHIAPSSGHVTCLCSVPSEGATIMAASAGCDVLPLHLPNIYDISGIDVFGWCTGTYTMFWSEDERAFNYFWIQDVLSKAISGSLMLWRNQFGWPAMPAFCFENARKHLFMAVFDYSDGTVLCNRTKLSIYRVTDSEHGWILEAAAARTIRFPSCRGPVLVLAWLHGGEFVVAAFAGCLWLHDGVSWTPLAISFDEYTTWESVYDNSNDRAVLVKQISAPYHHSLYARCVQSLISVIGPGRRLAWAAAVYRCCLEKVGK